MIKSDLLAYIAINCRLDYISDLSLTDKCKSEISEMDNRLFNTVEQWNEAVHYLTKNNDIYFDTVAAAKEYLINFEQ